MRAGVKFSAAFTFALLALVATGTPARATPFTGPMTCNAAYAGVIQYNKDEKVLQYCNGTNWMDMGQAGASEKNWTQVSAGGGTACGLRPDKTAWCWGNGTNGARGDNTTSSATKPLQVKTSSGGTGWSDWIQIDTENENGAGTPGSTTCGVRSNGTAWCWGMGDIGQRGDGTTTATANKPVQVGTAGTSTLFTDWKQISSGGASTCGVRTNGTAWCWGWGTSGQIGNSGTGSPTVPSQVVTSSGAGGWTDWTQISIRSSYSGNSTTCGVRSDGTAWCWGVGNYGNRGDGTTTMTTSKPSQVKDLAGTGYWTDWTKVSVGRFGVCGLRSNGTAWCWGYGGNGNLGNGTTTTTQSIPVQVGTGGTSTLFTDWTDIGVKGDGDYVCGVRGNGTAWCWGDGSGGKRGDGATSGTQTTPVQIKDSTGSGYWTDWTKIATTVSLSGSLACGLRVGGDIWCWGSNSASVGYSGGTPPLATPTLPVDTSSMPAASLPGCSNPSGAEGTIDYNAAEGTLQYCNGEYWVGVGATVPEASAAPIIQISAGYYTTCGLRSDKTAWCWGQGGYGQLGDGTTTAAQTIPVQVKDLTGTSYWSDWAQVSAGSYSACGRRTDNTAWCWGIGSTGQLGNGTTTGSQTTPVQVKNSAGTGTWSDWIQISVGYHSNCGLRSNGTVWCWGAGPNGELGNGTTTNPQTLPVQVGTAGTSTLWSDWTQISAGAYFVCGLRSNNQIYCWGQGTNSQLGNGTFTATQTTPVRVGTAGSSTLWSDWVQITAGYQTGCGRRTNGTSWCWGMGNQGALGNGGTSDSNVPVQVGAWTDWNEIASGFTNNCGLRTNGTVWCWGKGTYGARGDGTTMPVVGPSPVQVGTVATSTNWSDWDHISSGYGIGCGYRHDGTAWCWGLGSSGQRGDSSTSSTQATPVQVDATVFGTPTCSNPSGEAGTLVYNADEHVMQYCNGSDWVAIGWAN